MTSYKIDMIGFHMKGKKTTKKVLRKGATKMKTLIEKNGEWEGIIVMEFRR